MRWSSPSNIVRTGRGGETLSFLLLLLLLLLLLILRMLLVMLVHLHLLILQLLIPLHLKLHKMLLLLRITWWATRRRRKVRSLGERPGKRWSSALLLRISLLRHHLLKILITLRRLVRHSIVGWFHCASDSLVPATGVAARLTMRCSCRRNYLCHGPILVLPWR